MRRAFGMLLFLTAIALVALEQFTLLETATAVRSPIASAQQPQPPWTGPINAPSAPSLRRLHDLDALYPAEEQFWSKLDSSGRPVGRAHWLVELEAESRTPIPSQIHQTWKDSQPPRVLFSPRWARSLRDSNPGWSYRLWSDADNHALVASQYPSLLTMYDNYGSPIQRADVARYLIAHSHGGVYADLDTECFKPFAPIVRGASLVLSYKMGSNFSRGACNSVFGSAPHHPFWRVVFDVLRNRSATPLATGHTAVLYSTGPAVLREAIRRLLRLPREATITAAAMDLLHRHLRLIVLDASILHPVTADRRTEDNDALRSASTVCTHHFVSSWVAHSSAVHASTERRRQEGKINPAMHGPGQLVMTENRWGDLEQSVTGSSRKVSLHSRRQTTEAITKRRRAGHAHGASQLQS